VLDIPKSGYTHLPYLTVGEIMEKPMIGLGRRPSLVGVMFIFCMTIIVTVPAPVGADAMSDSKAGIAAQKKGDAKETLRLFSNAIAANGLAPRDWSQVFFNRGSLLTDMDNTKEEILDLDRAIIIDPSNEQAHYNLANAHIYNGEADNAIADKSRAININPKIAIAFANRGLAYFQKGKIRRAIEDYNEALRLEPKTSNFYIYRGEAKERLGDDDRALADFNTAIHLKPDSSLFHNVRGTLYHKTGKLELAIKDFDAAIRIFPNHQWAMRNRAKVFDAQGRHELAIKEYDALLKMFPNDGPLLLKRRETQAKLSQSGRAKTK